MIKYKENFLILSLLLLALCLRIHPITRSLFYDELYTAVHGVQAPSLSDALFKNFSETNHLGYTAIAYLTCHLLGAKEWTLRLPALLFGLGSIFLFWQWTRKYFGDAVAILGSLLMSLAPAHIIWSASARGYSACIFFTILSTSLYFSLLRKPSLKTTLMITLTNTFAPSFQVYFCCVLLAQFLHFLLISALVYTGRAPFIKKESLLNILLSVVSTTLCSIFIFLPVMGTLKNIATGHRELVPTFPLTLLHDLLSLPLWPLGLACLILILAGFIYSNDRLYHWRTYVAVLFLMVFPIWLWKPVYIYPRFFAYLLPFIFLLMANGMTSIIKNTPKQIFSYALTMAIAVIAAMIFSWTTLPSKIAEDFQYKFRESVQFAESVASPGTSFCAFGNEDDFFQFYAHRPIITFKTFEDFQKYYQQEKEIICFAMNGPPMPQEHKKIFLFTLMLNPKEKSFDNIIVFDLKG